MAGHSSTLGFGQTIFDKSWKECLETGRKIMEAIERQEPKEPRYSSISDFEAAQYIPFGPWRSFICDHLRDTELGLPSSGWLRWRLVNRSLTGWRNFLVDFTIDTNAKAGAITVLTSYGPVNPQTPGGPMLEIIHRLSDIAFILLKEHAAREKEDLKLNYFTITNVGNGATKTHFVDILGKSTKADVTASKGEWPGYVLRLDGPEGIQPGEGGQIDPNTFVDKDTKGEGTFAKVLLGSPTGLAAGYILIDRQKDFPNRTIKELRLVKSNYNDPTLHSESAWSFGMIIAIGDLQPANN